MREDSNYIGMRCTYHKVDRGSLQNVHSLVVIETIDGTLNL